MIPETRPNDWDEIVARLLVHLDAGTTDSADGVHAVDVSDYLDADRWAREMDRIFRHSPVVVALTAHLPEPGSYRSIDLAGIPVLSVRQADGSVRAFINACRHRGAQIVAHGTGKARRFTCPYHAWSYDGSGALLGVAGRPTFGDIADNHQQLTELPCAERSGFVFAVLDPAVSFDVDEWLAGYGPILDALGLDDVELLDERELIGPNWKVAYDGYVDGYHLDILHKDTLGKDVMGNIMTCDAWGPHQRVAFARRNLHELRDIPREEWQPGGHMGLVHTVFPHVSVAGNGGTGMMVSQLIPGPTPDRSRTIQTHVVTRNATEEERAATAQRADFLEWVVNEEDYKTGLGIQAALASGANTEFLFGRNEPGNQRFHQWVDRLLAEPFATSLAPPRRNLAAAD
ncbi:aromatic ring-hydroxylating oxygenase subunit alpha [Desertimonas flava]|uniref:aromatic ring-hydroxylating oxygenase subunit alpha n=1 Tax=Desertimonas flava TaxID=2064846 RepID=UPI000E3500D3|nr:aromatic ring-hydroxylating dioxygenase subunit alpha [Desertimonas flava]